MSRSSRSAFLALVLAQAVHSAEEYAGRLYDVLAPARFVSGALFGDRRVGFVVFNLALVAFGFWCYFGPVRHGRASAPPLMWGWAVLELMNGAAHVVWAMSAGAYRPGLVTAPVLVVTALALALALRHDRPRAGAAA